MRKLYFFLVLLLFFQFSFGQAVFINEIHYENSNTDVAEGIEIAGPANLDLNGFTLLLYDGNNGIVYGTINLSGVIPNQQNGFGTLNFLYPGIKNGPDGIALIDKLSNVIQFLSYGGAFTAANSTASGLTSADIGKQEGSSTSLGNSLQLLGSGQVYTDFFWSNPILASPGAINNTQNFSATAAFKQEKKNDLSIFPNPVSNGYFTLSTTNNSSKKIEVFDVLGKRVLLKQVNGNNNQINVPNLTSGIYILNVSDQNKIITRKLIVN